MYSREFLLCCCSSIGLSDYRTAGGPVGCRTNGLSDYSYAPLRHVRQPMLKLKTHSGFHDLFLKYKKSFQSESIFVKFSICPFCSNRFNKVAIVSQIKWVKRYQNEPTPKKRSPNLYIIGGKNLCFTHNPITAEAILNIETDYSC